MSVEIAWKQNILVTDFHLLKSLLVVFGFGSQAFVCGFSRQNINSVAHAEIKGPAIEKVSSLVEVWTKGFSGNVIINVIFILHPMQCTIWPHSFSEFPTSILGSTDYPGC